MKKETKREIVKKKIMNMGKTIGLSFEALVYHVGKIHKIIHAFEKMAERIKKKKKK